MAYDKDKVDEMALALMHLSSMREKEGVRAWKGLAWEITNRMFEKGWISDPKGKARSASRGRRAQDASLGMARRWAV